VVRALRLAALEMVETFPMGIRTRISRDTLSGGQQQRILIARALLGSPGILFLDEATSALDSITQKQIQDRLEHMRITRVVAAHRLSTVRNADRILVLERGRVIRSGTFDELSAGDGLFRRLLSGMDSGEGRDMGSDKL
jgi:ABC-type multidrug transport system fused ATPase/permease subunit